MGDEGWTEAVSDKTKRKQKSQQKQWDESVRVAEEYAKKNSITLPKGYQKKLQDVDPKNAIAVLNELVEAPGKATQAKTKPKATKGPKWDSPEELVDIIKGIVQSAAFVDVAGVGTKLQTLTNHPWNKKFKPVYGALGTFIRSYPKEFYVDDTDRVYVRSEWAAAERKKQEKAQAKKAEAGSGGDSSNTAKKAAAKKKPVTAKRRWSLCGCLDCSSPLLLLFMGLMYLIVCSMILSQGDIHRSLVDWLVAKHYVARSNPSVLSFLSAGDGVKSLTARLVASYQEYIMQFLKWYGEFRRTNETWRSIEEVFALGLRTIWQGIVQAWNATIGGTAAGLALERWTVTLQSSQAWQSVTQNWNRLLAR
jgi:hypothetical protein